MTKWGDAIMTARQYRAVFACFRAHPAAMKLLRLCQSGSVAAVYILYIGTIALLALHRDARVIGFVLVPAAVFLIGSVLRAVIDRPRPYEALDFIPLFPKDTHGKSMPSRHCFSAAAIAVAAAGISAPLGIVLWILAGVIAVSRVLTGVHYPSDVLAGLAFGGLAAALGLALPVF